MARCRRPSGLEAPELLSGRMTVGNWISGLSENDIALYIWAVCSACLFVYFRFNWRYRGDFLFRKPAYKREYKRLYGENLPGILRLLGVSLWYVFISAGFGLFFVAVGGIIIDAL